MITVYIEVIDRDEAFIYERQTKDSAPFVFTDFHTFQEVRDALSKDGTVVIKMGRVEEATVKEVFTEEDFDELDMDAYYAMPTDTYSVSEE